MARVLGLLYVLLSCTLSMAQEEPPAPAASFPVKDRDPSNPFGKVRTPSQGPVDVRGGYAAGCIAGAAKLPVSGKGWEVVRISRNRMYGHPILVDLLKRAGKTRGPKQSPLIFGDMSQPRGGPMTSGHSSHQLGLDVDVWLQSLSPGMKMTDQLRETLPLVSVLKADYKSVDPRKWKADYERQILWFAAQPEVDRIFVNAAIKKKLCASYPGDARLKKVRPWYAHNEHFHVRLACPQGQGACVPQKPLEEIECEASKLAYWFSNEVIEHLKNPTTSPAKIVHLPTECRDVIEAP